MSRLSERIKLVRKFRKLSQQDFAARLGVERSYISKIETESSNPSEQLIRLICAEFGINLRWLRSGEGAMGYGEDYDPEKVKKLESKLEEMGYNALITELKILSTSIKQSAERLSGLKYYEQPINPPSNPKYFELVRIKNEFDNNIMALQELLSKIFLRDKNQH